MMELCNRIECTGCAACYNVCNKQAIKMIPDQEGFLIPFINNNLCVECGLCAKVCPVINHSINRLNNAKPKVYAAYNLDSSIRKMSSSGGMFSALSYSFFKESSGRDYVVAAEFDSNLHLRHQLAGSYEQLNKMRGSKYVQSEIGDCFKTIESVLKGGGKIMFFGTPCQIAGLKSFLRKDYQSLYTIDLICHGVPSPLLFKNYLQQIGLDTDKEYQNYLFRDYSSSGLFVSSFIRKNGRKHMIGINKHSYIMAYLKGWIHRECCYNCKFTGMPRQGDCTLGDFWGIISNKVPFKGDRSKGVSVVLVNNQKGAYLVDSISNIVYKESHSIDEALIDNHNLIESDKRPFERNVVCNELIELSSIAFMKKYHLSLPHRSIRQRAHLYLSKVMHALIGCLRFQ